MRATVQLCFLMTALIGSLHAQPAVAQADLDAAIIQLATNSDCSRFRWADRGRAPAGYIRGMALAYRDAFCRAQRGEAGSIGVMTQPLGSARADALTHYALDPPTPALRLRTLYTLLIGLGMRESSGNTTVGRDTTVSNPTAENAEAGLFQTSFDSRRASEVLPTIAATFADTARCRLSVFLQGVRDRAAPIVGSGPGATFQELTKRCPVFAAEYAAVMLRVQRTHYGPINRRQAQIAPVCERMLAAVETVAPCGP